MAGTISDPPLPVPRPAIIRRAPDLTIPPPAQALVISSFGGPPAGMVPGPLTIVHWSRARAG